MNIVFYSPPNSFSELFRYLCDELYSYGHTVQTGHWQGLTDVPQTDTIELQNIHVQYRVPETQEELHNAVQPSTPWAEAQFQERIGGRPLNPGETYKLWPWYRDNVEKHKGPGHFSHTYMERFWPRFAQAYERAGGRSGIRFRYGDYLDVIELLMIYPQTRQAYLPIFFPEDTGAHHGERVPCTLGYHFLNRRNQLHLNYPIRSCDLLRHFRDDVYMAGRLLQHTLAQLQDLSFDRGEESWNNIKPGFLTMSIFSLHVFSGDRQTLIREGHPVAPDEIYGGPA